jgi:hypothetical protein
VLGKVFRAAAKHWDVAQGDEEAAAWYLEALRSVETALMFIHAQMGGGSSLNVIVARAWERSDREAFSGAVQQWDRLLSRAPYR